MSHDDKKRNIATDTMIRNKAGPFTEENSNNQSILGNLYLDKCAGDMK